VAVFVGAGFLAGHRGARAAPEPPHPALLTGADWAALGSQGKEAYLKGFIAGAAAEQVRANAADSGRLNDSSAVSSAAVAKLLAAGDLRFSYAPSVYAAQLDDYYWWANHGTVPIVDAMIGINKRMKQP
jgi:hypothetical protein